MKKTIFTALCLCIAMLLSSCAGTNNNLRAESLDEYIQYDNGKDIFSLEKYEKKAQKKRNDDIFGNTKPLNYDRTWKSSELSYEFDEYSNFKNFEFVDIYYRTDTKKVAKYVSQVAADRNYKSAVGPYSSEADYIAYAKNVLLEKAGVSADGWDVEIQTYRSEYGYTDGFINYVHETPSYNAEYMITFSKKIGGIERYDKMLVHMTNVGEIIEMNAINYEESFAPFADVQIDKEKLEEAAWKAFGNIWSNEIASEKIQSIELMTKNGSLWARVMIEYSFSETKGGVQYVFEVARLVDASENSQNAD